ncbi:M16 family metallopeptidase [Ilumatobacter sp.]|uniref:M16 family metallopeptidase n=1 Tax=Ilumatobacter sp. TaxID=1967498 RepID=UPI003750A490
MLGVSRRPFRFRLVGIAIVTALATAACTGSSDATPTTDAAGGGQAGGRPRTEVVKPDESALLSLVIDPAIVTGTLDNGLQYFIRENDNPGSRVEMRLTIDAGAAFQSEDQGGGAHFLEHMLFNGTEQFPENELIAVLRSFGAGFGADINAYTSYDETVYELTMPTADRSTVETGLDVLQQWLSAAIIDPAQVEAERGVVLDEWRGSAQSSSGRVFDEIQKFFLDGSPYENRKPIGTDQEINRTTDGPLRAFYDDWYRPDNASVIVVGDINAQEMEREIIERFDPATARGDSPKRPDLIVEPSSDARALVFNDPDVSEGFAFVTLPLTADTTGSREAFAQRNILESLAFDIIGTRLSNDALRGDAPFDAASVDSSGFVRSLSAPEIFVSADGADLEASTQAVLDAYERVRRFGFTTGEVARAVEARRSAAEVDYDGRNSRQDASYADEYVRHVLEGESVPTGQRWFDFITDVLDRATPETLAYMFVTRYETAGPHIFVTAPADEIDDVPAASVFVAQVESMPTRELETRESEAAVGESLLDPPDPVEEVNSEVLADGSDISFVAPVLLTFENGVRVAFNNTPITDGAVFFEGRSPGGTSVLADEDVAPAEVAANVVEGSGVGDFDPVAIDAFLSDKEVFLDAAIDVFTEGFFGSSATSDLETAFQLIYLIMTQPRVDAVTLEQYIDDELPLAEDPSINPDYARFKALTEARYDDPRYQLLDVDDLNSVTAEDVERVYIDRFGDASDWTFSFSGDFDIDAATSLARTYLGTLPATGRFESVDYVEPPAPEGAVIETVRAGEGDQASVSFLITGPGTSDRRDDIAARVVQEVLTARLTDVIREELGESYSPFAAIELTGGATPLAETFLSISTGPDLVDNVSIAVLEQLADIRTNGVPANEFASATEKIRNELELFSNEQINDEILDALTDPAGNASFEDFLEESTLLGSISRNDMTGFFQRWVPDGQYIEIRVLPR